MRIKLLFLVTAVTLLLFPQLNFAQPPALGVASSFVLFTAGGAFNGDAATSVVGDIGTNAGAFTPPGFLVGATHIPPDPVAVLAAIDVTNAYADLAGRSCGLVLGTPFGNQTLLPNVYCLGGASVLDGTLILDGAGDPNALFIFQIDGALAANPLSVITLINGANLCNVYFQVNGAVSLGTNAVFQGTIVAAGAINLGTGASLTGRGLTTSGAISTSANIVTLPASCMVGMSPTITCPADVTVTCASQVPVADPSSVVVTVTCPGAFTVVSLGDVISNQTCANSYTITRTYEATDGCGGIAFCTQTITVNDQTPPTIACPANVTVSCAGLVPLGSNTAAATSDNCGGAVTVTFSDVTSNQICTNRFTITRTYLATDACGNTASCAQTITVNDQTPPTIACPANVTVSCASLVPLGSNTAATTSDNCGGAVTVTFSDVISNQICTNRFTITRTYLATDPCGNTATCAQTITVNDQTPPTIACPANVTVSCAGLVPPGSNTAAITSDNCGGAVTVTFSDVISNQICTNRFTITRTYLATDACGNTATCAQTITVNDQTPPTIACPANITVLCAALVPPGSNTAAITSDNCGGAVTVTFADVISNQICANRFLITRTYTATDACGNIANCAQTITVFDNSLPIIACPANVTVSCVGLVPVASSTAVTTSDNCGGAVTVTSADVISNQICTNRFTITRTYRADDECGNSVRCVQTITVNDQTPPTITCPANISVSCANQVPTPNPGSVTTSDNCGGQVTVVFVSDVISNQICANRFTITRTYQATDLCGNISTCAQTIEVNGLASASIICPANVTVSCASQVPAANPASVTVTATCGGQVNITSTDVISNQICVNHFTITRTYMATDVCGNMVTCAQTITVFDQIPPTINCPSGVSVTCASQVPPASINAVTTSDNCVGGVVVTFLGDVISNQLCANRFTITRAYLATDACGNTASCAQTITVFDGTVPTISCPANVSVTCASQVPPGSTTAVTTSDNCGGAVVVTFSDVISNQLCANRFTITRTYLATDACGNTASCAQTITVFDQTPPSITCPANVTVSCAGLVPAASTTAVTTSDNCGGAVVVTLLSNVISNQICANRFTITRTYLATDACGNTASCAQTITVFDQTPPSISCPANVTVSCAGLVPVASTTAVTTSDNCGGAVVVTFSDVISNQICANRFTITRTYLATDACGNTASCAQTITVFDQTPPSITCPANVTVSCAGLVPVASTTAVTTSDNCGGAVVVTLLSNVISNQICANRFTIIRTYLATDACGNTASCAQTITVFDQTPPSIACPVNVTVSCVGLVPVPTPLSITTSDNCGGAVTVTSIDVISNQICANHFTITRTYLATDACGNTASCAQTITVFDQTPPSIICPANVTVSCIGLVPLPAPLAINTSDNCGGAVAVTVLSEVISNQVCANRFTLTRTYLATDACGNTASCAQIITVFDQTPPSMICPENISVSCTAQMPAVSTSSITTNDACSGGIVSIIMVGEAMSDQTCANRYKLTRTYRASDVCGNAFTCAQTITVNDQTAPVFTVLPQNVSVECIESGNAEAKMQAWLETFGNAQVSGQCGATEEITTHTQLVSAVPACEGSISTFVRTYEFRATDGCGNISTALATFSLIDTTPPVIICPPGNLLLTCEYDLPAPDPSAVVAYDNCGESVKLMLTIHSVGTGCRGYKRSVEYWYMATDKCGNMSNCDQSFEIMDSIPPLYSGPDTLHVSCVNDLPGAGDITNILAPYMTDNCSDIICLGRVSIQNGLNSVTYRVKAKDLCGNWTSKFNVTFVATGICRPLCTASQGMWGSQDGIINNIGTTEAIDSFLNDHEGVTAGKLGKTVTATSAPCVQRLLPGNDGTEQFSPGKHTFSAANNCDPSSPLLTSNGTLKNVLAANVIAMQMNIWYNLKFNDRALGVQRLANLPACLVDPIVLDKLETDQTSVQGLLNMSNDYLAGVGYFPQGFGNLLNEALDNLNSYWQNCQTHNPCPAPVIERASIGNQFSKASLAPNPVLDMVVITLNSPADAELRVRFVSGTGSLQYEEIVQVVKGENTLSYSTKNFPSGMYTVVLQQGKDLETLRMLKVRD